MTKFGDDLQYRPPLLILGDMSPVTFVIYAHDHWTDSPKIHPRNCRIGAKGSPSKSLRWEEKGKERKTERKKGVGE